MGPNESKRILFDSPDKYEVVSKRLEYKVILVHLELQTKLSQL